MEFICSAWGDRAWSDGLDGNANLMANMSLPPVEIPEAEQPLQILCTEFIQDVGGPGKYRGGASIRRDYKMLEAEAVLQVPVDDAIANLVIYPIHDERVVFRHRDGRIRERAKTEAVAALIAAHV